MYKDAAAGMLKARKQTFQTHSKASGNKMGRDRGVSGPGVLV